ncbi:MAG: helix-turn-helix domain-containing protein [Actinomycetota bacterium]
MGRLTAPEPDLPAWTFLTNHAHVLIAISRNPELRQRDIAFAVGITVGAVQRIIHELEADGYLRTIRVGRRNRYELDRGKPLRHPLEDGHSVGELLSLLDQ